MSLEILLRLDISVCKVVIDDERLEILAFISLKSNVVDACNVDKLNSRLLSGVVNPVTNSFKAVLEDEFSEIKDFNSVFSEVILSICSFKFLMSSLKSSQPKNKDVINRVDKEYLFHFN